MSGHPLEPFKKLTETFNFNAGMIKELAESEVVATSAGGMVEVVMGCDRTLTSIKIKPEAVDPDDVEMLEDMIMAAFNEAMKLVEEEQQRVMGPLTGGAGGLGGLL